MVVGPSLHGILINLFKNPVTNVVNHEIGYLFSASILTLIAIIPFSITMFKVKENESKNNHSKIRNNFSFLKGIKIMLTNKSFLCIMLIYLCTMLTLQFVQNNLLLFSKYVVNMEDYFSYFLLCFLIVSAISLPIWATLAKKYDKKLIYIIGAILLVITLSCFFFVPQSNREKEEKLDVNIIYMLLISFFAGIGFGVMFFIPHSLFPEVIEIDELETGERREGMYYSFFVFFQKLGLALSLAMSNYILSLTGFISSNNENPVVIQPYSAKLALRIMVSFAPVVVLLISFIPLYFFPINKRLHEENLKLLREKKENFVDLSIEERN